MKVLIYAGGLKTVIRSGVGQAALHQARALELAGIEYTFDQTQDYDIVHINTVFPDSRMMASRARLQGKKVVCYGHSTMEDFRNSFIGSNQLAPAFRRWITSLYGQGDVVITPTPYSKELIESYGIERPVISLSNGIDLQAFARSEERRKRFRERYCFRKSSRVVLGVGHYIGRKGIVDFVEMAKRFPEYEFIWFGQTPSILVPRKIRRALHTQLPNLRFPGYAQKEEMIDAYSGSDVFFFPTYEETEGIVLLEAMAAHLPVLLRDIPIYQKWLPDRTAVYKGKDLEGFAQVLPQMFNKTLPDLTQEAYRIVSQQSLENIGSRLADIYDTLLAGAEVRSAGA